ncbi:MAG: hypothetical protein V5A84_00655, partial [Planctomycetota bacterium]
CQDGSVVFWDLEKQTRYRRSDLGMERRIASLDYAQGGDILGASTVSAVAFWDVESGERVELMPGAEPRQLVDFCPSRPLVAAVVEDGGLEVWDTGLRRRVCDLSVEGSVRALHCGGRGERVAAANDSNEMSIYDIETGRRTAGMGRGPARVWSVRLSPDEALLASSNSDTTVRLWNVAGGELETALHKHVEWVMAVSFSPRFRWLASGGNDETVRIWGIQGDED